MPYSQPASPSDPRQRKVAKWESTYKGNAYTVMFLSVIVLGLAAASIAQQNSGNSAAALTGVMAWNIVLAILTFVAELLLAKHAKKARAVLLCLALVLFTGLWASAFVPILTVGLWSGSEAQFRKRHLDVGPAADLIQMSVETGPILGCMIGGILIALLFLFQSIFLCVLRGVMRTNR